MNSGSGIDLSNLSFLPTQQDMLALFFTFIFVVWAIYSIIAAYHWFRYGRDSWMSTPAIFVHIFISGWLMIYALTGFK